MITFSSFTFSHQESSSMVPCVQQQPLCVFAAHFTKVPPIKTHEEKRSCSLRSSVTLNTLVQNIKITLWCFFQVVELLMLHMCALMQAMWDEIMLVPLVCLCCCCKWSNEVRASNKALLFSLDGVSRGHIIAWDVAFLSCVDGASLPPVSLSTGGQRHRRDETNDLFM